MSVYTVHEPPPRKGEAAASPERYAFLRDGFHFWAFIVPPIWMLRHRLWLALIGYVLVTFALAVALTLAGGSPNARMIATGLVGLLVGFEASTLRRWKMRKRWKQVGTVVANNLEEAERRFFAQWSGPSAQPVTLTAKVAPPSAPRSSSTDVIGLFPEPGAPR